MKLNWKIISQVFARTLGVKTLTLDTEGKEVLASDQRETIMKHFGEEVLTLYEQHAATGDNAESEVEMGTFLDAIGRAGAENRVALAQELAEVKFTNDVLSAQVERLSKTHEGKPATIPGGAGSTLRIFSIDSKASHNMFAATALASGRIPSFEASTIDVADLRAEFGAYSSQGNNLELMRNIYTGFTSAKHMTPKRAIETYKVVQSDYTDVVQEFSSQWTPTGSSKFTPNEIKNYRHKINFKIIPADVADSWLMSLYNEKSTPDQMPITRYIVQNILLPSIVQNVEMKMIGKGKYKAKANPNDTGKPEESMQGIETQLVEAAKSGKKGINFYPDAKDLIKASDEETLDYIDNFANKITQKYQAVVMNIFCSADVYKKYKRAYKKKWGVGSGTENPDFGKDRVDFTNFSLQVLDCMYGSPIIFCTPKSNFIQLQNLNAPQVITDIQKIDYEVRYYGEFWLGVGFAIGEMVFASVPKDYDPQTAISDDGSTDFWLPTNTSDTVEGA